MIGRLPPAGIPLGAADLRAAARGARNPDRAREDLLRAIESVCPERSVRLFSSGRAGLFRLLETLRAIRPERTVLAMGAYTCWSVPAAAARAGLEILPVDLDPSDLDFREESLRQVAGEKVLALVTHHLFGRPNRLARAEEAARAWGAFLIDDGAQGFGARDGERPAGSAGVAGLLSFGRGKGIPALGGGAVLLEKGSEAEAAFRAFAGGGRGAAKTARAAAQALFFRPSLYGIPASFPPLRIGETIYDERFPVRPLDGATASLAARLLRDDERRREARRARERFYREEAAREKIPLRFLAPSVGDAALRVPVYVDGKRRGQALRAAGSLGVTAAYPAPIHRIPGLPPERIAARGACDGAERIAREILTLPVHPLVNDDRAGEILRRIGEALR